jgi:rhamnosyltransferase subunit B
MRHAAELFEMAIVACRTLAARAVLVTSLRAQLPPELPSFVHHCPFAPFQKLFPLCAAVVHHGGIGTVSKALAAGTPQLIVPFAYDQKDNALRIKKLGTGDWLASGLCNSELLSKAIKGILGPRFGAQARTIAKRCEENNGLHRAADLVEEFCRRS